MATTNLYLNFNGNCEAAFLFYQSIFGGDFDYFARFGEMPENQEFQVSEAYKDKVMHVSLQIGSSTLMGSDCDEEQAAHFIQGNNFSVSVTAGSKAEADQLFNALAAEGNITMPIGSTFWGDYFGMLTDKYGINWMVSFPEQEEP